MLVKRRTILCLSTLALLTISATVFYKEAALSAANLPEQIDAYYRNYNYVSLFSSEREREIIADALMCEGRLSRATQSDLNFCNEIPSIPKSQRLDKMQTLIAELSRSVIRDVNSMSVQAYVPGEGSHLRAIDPQRQPLRRNPYSPSAEVFDIRQIKRGDNAITVKVAVYPLDPAKNAQLISQYETQTGSRSEELSSGALVSLAAPSSVSRQEFHQWIKEGETWKKFETSAALINN
jgi:hypothetical protein